MSLPFKITLAKLLLWIPAWLLAFLISQNFFQPHYDRADYQLADREVVQAASYAHSEIWEIPIDSEDGQTRMDRRKKITEFVARTLDPIEDPWGNKYQVIGFNSDEHFHVYSFGADGISLTDGNDVDDIHSWSNRWRDYYEKPAHWHHRTRMVWRSVLITPIIYGLFCAIIWFFTRFMVT